MDRRHRSTPTRVATERRASASRSRVALRATVLVIVAAGSGLAGCHCSKKAPAVDAPSIAGSASISPVAMPTGSAALAAASAIPEGPKLASIQMQTWVNAEPKWGGQKLGYLRAGAILARDAEPVGTSGCQGGWYKVKPVGYVCIGEGATLDMNHPVVRVTSHRRPDLNKPMPYRYGFIRSVAPQYLHVPNKEEQLSHEFKLENHLKWYARHEGELNIVTPGANDVPESERGKPILVRQAPPPKEGKASEESDDESKGAPPPGSSATLSLLELFGADGAHAAIPWWLTGQDRAVPQLSSFQAPKYAVIAGRVKRHTGLAFIDAFETNEASMNRAFAVTTDLRLVPISKLKPNVGSQWHGVDLSDDFTLPIAFAHPPDKAGKRPSIRAYRIEGANATADGAELVWRQAVALTGKDKTLNGTRYFEMKDGRWLKKNEIVIARKPDEWPTFAKGDQKWIDLSVIKQTLVLWVGDKPVYATLVSTGQDGIGDPKTSKSTVRGVFKIRDKHVTTTMDANEVDNKFELRDVPWVQYFEAGYALHAAYWHDEYGTPRSHGCVNLSPIDARKVFLWTDPQLPPGWHGVSASDDTGKGTIVNSHI